MSNLTVNLVHMHLLCLCTSRQKQASTKEKRKLTLLWTGQSVKGSNFGQEKITMIKCAKTVCRKKTCRRFSSETVLRPDVLLGTRPGSCFQTLWIPQAIHDCPRTPPSDCTANALMVSRCCAHAITWTRWKHECTVWTGRMKWPLRYDVRGCRIKRLSIKGEI